MQPDAFTSTRVGQVIHVPDMGGYFAFSPHPLPPEIVWSNELANALSEAAWAIGDLAGVGRNLPNPHLLMIPFMRQEAVLSSRIEGTRASLGDLYTFEISGQRPLAYEGDVQEVYNYVQALEHGLALCNSLPIGHRMLCEVHEKLMQDVRGSHWKPGNFRDGPVHIGGQNLQDAPYVPPPVPAMIEAFSAFERFLHEESEIPPLMRIALCHYQFEAIHPYLDGNGRIGRLLITLFLCAKEVLPTPLLYLSAYFERRRDEYYDHLLAVSQRGTWQDWVRFFLHGVAEQARDALLRSRRVRQLQDGYRGLLQERGESGNAFRLLDELFANPFMTTPLASHLLSVTSAGARGILQRLVDAGVVEEISGTWPKFYVARELLEAIEQPVASQAS